MGIGADCDRRSKYSVRLLDLAVGLCAAMGIERPAFSVWISRLRPFC